MIWQNVKVVTPATNFDLVSLAEVKAFFNITTTTDDVRIQQLITFNSLIIADICDRVLAQEEVEETVGNSEWDTVSGNAVNLDRWPVAEIQEVTVGGSPISEDSYTIEERSGILRCDMSNEVVVKYKGGYSLPSEAPRALSLACLEGIRASYYYGSRDPMIQAITDNNSGSIRFFPPPGISRTGGGSSGGANPNPLSPSATALIFPYRRRALA